MAVAVVARAKLRSEALMSSMMGICLFVLEKN
jgi:hypothetical protein